jgi:trimeric autotransporter adhesin
MTDMLERMAKDFEDIACDLKTSGNVGIGITSPKALLDVNGAIRLSDGTQNCNSSSNGAVRFNSSTHVLQYCYSSAWTNVGSATPAGANTQIQFNNSGAMGASANLTWSGTALVVTGDINYTGLLKDTSDRRAKHDITPLPGQLAKLMQLEPVSFVMNNDPRHRTELGLIAQDVEPLYPDLVDTDASGMKSMAYVGLIGPMIKAMQEQQAEIKTLWAAILVCFSTTLLLAFRLWRTGKV